MEDGLRDIQQIKRRGEIVVLILVVVEDGLREGYEVSLKHVYKLS